MNLEKILEKLNEKNISKIKLVTREGDETIVSKNDTIEKDEENCISIKRNGKETILNLDDIYKIIQIKKSPVNTTIHSLPKDLKRRYRR